MRLIAVHPCAFRNLADERVAFGPRGNALIGPNAQGKTNLLEAVYLACTGRSFRAARLSDLIRHGQPAARVTLDFQAGGLTRTLQADLRPTGRTLRLDGKPATATDAARAAPLVLFVPEEIPGLRASRAERRRILDRAVFALDPGYLELATAWQRALRARNALLSAPRRADDALLDAHDQTLARLCAEVTRARGAAAADLAPRFSRAYAALDLGQATVGYRPHSAGDAGAFAAALRSSRPRDRAAGRTLVGPQRDDLALAIDGRDAAACASQGQTRALLLAIKIALCEALIERRGEVPLLLLDDVLSELDGTRGAQLARFLDASGCCWLLTTTEPAQPSDTTRLFAVSQGRAEALLPTPAVLDTLAVPAAR